MKLNLRNVEMGAVILVVMSCAAGGVARSQDLSKLPPLVQQKIAVPDTVPTTKPAWTRAAHGKTWVEHSHPGTPATPAPAGVYVALGDSITFGTGATDSCSTYPDHPVDIEAFCAESFGKSYAERVAYALRKDGVAGKFMNLGIGGATVGQVVQEELPWLPAEATVITLYIGTNDLRLPGNQGLGVDDTMALYKKGYSLILDYLRTHTPQAKVVLVNIPNEKLLDGLGKFKPEQLEIFDKTSQLGDTFINGFYPKYPVVDTICQAYTYDPKLRSNGSVHPNDAGTEPLAAQIISVIESKHSPAPAKSCTWFNNPAGTPPAPAPAPKADHAAFTTTVAH